MKVRKGLPQEVGYRLSAEAEQEISRHRAGESHNFRGKWEYGSLLNELKGVNVVGPCGAMEAGN